MPSVMLQSEPRGAAAAQTVQGGIKAVLLHVQEDDGFEGRLQAALDIARASGGHVTCLDATPISTYAGYETYGGAFVLTATLEQLEEHRAAMRAKVEAQLANEDVAWSYEQQTIDPATALVGHGALADLIVLSRSPDHTGSAYAPLSVIGSVLAASRTPVLLCGHDRKGFDPFGTAVVAWNGSFEAANALRAALPLLVQAAAVHIVTVDEDKQYDFPPLGASEYLSRHGVHAELVRETRGTLSVEDRIVATAEGLGAAWLVAGAYGHSRAREFLFGGVTRSLLKDCPLPLVLSR